MIPEERIEELADQAARGAGAIYDIEPIRKALRLAAEESISKDAMRYHFIAGGGVPGLSIRFFAGRGGYDEVGGAALDAICDAAIDAPMEVVK